MARQQQTGLASAGRQADSDVGAVLIPAVNLHRQLVRMEIAAKDLGGFPFAVVEGGSGSNQLFEQIFHFSSNVFWSHYKGFGFYDNGFRREAARVRLPPAAPFKRRMGG
jgi:hypothetical protein